MIINHLPKVLFQLLLIFSLGLFASSAEASNEVCESLKSSVLEPEKLSEVSFNEYCTFLLRVEKLKTTIIKKHGSGAWKKVRTFDSSTRTPASNGWYNFHYYFSISNIVGMANYLNDKENRIDPTLEKVELDWGVLIRNTADGWKIDFGEQNWNQKQVILDNLGILNNLIQDTENGETPKAVMTKFYGNFLKHPNGDEYSDILQ